MTDMNYLVDVFTGIRPTGGLTVANYLGAVHPIVNLQKEGHKPLVFVADLHALTDNEPGVARAYTRGVVADYLALGIDPRLTNIFVQSHIQDEILLLTLILSRLVSVAELIRVPTLKDKIKEGGNAESANALLMLYPVMMAADILMQRAHYIPVGEDQVAHLEMTQKLARRFNAQYADVFPKPQVEVVETLRILSLKGKRKMSKSYPEGAIFLTDEPDVAQKKIHKAQTSFESDMSPHLSSHIIVAKGLTQDEVIRQEIDEIVAQHLAGKSVMGEFKAIFANVVKVFLAEFQERRREITADPSYIDEVLEEGNVVAKRNASETMELVMEALYST